MDSNRIKGLRLTGMAGGTAPAPVEMFGYRVFDMALQTVSRIDEGVVVGSFVTAAHHVDMAGIAIGRLAGGAAAEFDGGLNLQAGAFMAAVTVKLAAWVVKEWRFGVFTKGIGEVAG